MIQRKSQWLAALFPVMLCLVYALTLSILPPVHWPFFHSEWGPVELLTATAFAVTAGLAALTALRLGRRSAGAAVGPWWARLWFVAFAAGALFMFLEETSFGQHYWGYDSPDFFEQHNKQSEMNLHNLMGDKPSSTLRRIADAGLPVFAIVAPLVFGRGRDAYRRGHWTWYILPRWEMAAWVVLAAVSSPVRKLAFGDDARHEFRGSLSEFKELLWAGALLTYAWCMWRRLSAPAEAGLFTTESTESTEV
jgi:hypothetical protein